MSKITVTLELEEHQYLQFAEFMRTIANPLFPSQSLPIQYAPPKQNDEPGHLVVQQPAITQAQAEARAALERMDPTLLAIAAGDAVDESEPIQAISTAEPPPAPRKRRRKSSDIELEVASPTPLVAAPVVPEVATFTLPEPVEEPVAEPVYVEVAKPVVIEGLPTAEEMKKFRTELFGLTSDVLPKAGMMPIEGIGGPNSQLRLFAQEKYGAAELKNLTAEQWKDFLSYLQTTLKEHGAEYLVKVIQTAIGVPGAA